MLKYITTIYQYQTYQHQIPHVDRALKELHLNEGSGLLNRRNSLYGKWIVFLSRLICPSGVRGLHGKIFAFAASCLANICNFDIWQFPQRVSFPLSSTIAS